MQQDQNLKDPWHIAQAQLPAQARVINLDDYSKESRNTVLEINLSSELQTALQSLKEVLRKWSGVFEAMGISRYPAESESAREQQKAILENGNVAEEIVKALMAVEVAGAILPRAVSSHDPKAADKANIFLRNKQYQDVQAFLDKNSDSNDQGKTLGQLLDQAPFVEWSRHLLGGFIGDAGIVSMILREDEGFPTLKAEVQSEVEAKITELRDYLVKSSDEAKSIEYRELLDRKNRLDSFSNIPTTLLGKIINEIHLAAPVAQAHRERIEDLLKTYENIIDIFKDTKIDPQRILILGCGPATELFRFLASTPCRSSDQPRLEFKAVDFAPATLETFEKNAAKTGRSDIDFITELKNLIRVGVAFKRGLFNEPLDERVFAYCAGLYDYLGKEFAEGLDSLMLEASVAGGFACATNVASSNPNSNGMRLLLGWDLIYRDREEMRELGAQAMRDFHTKHHAGLPYIDGFRADIVHNEDFLADPKQLKPGEYCVTSTKNGVNLFLWMRREDDLVRPGMRF